MNAPVFSTIDGAAWRKALTEARKRRKGQGKRIREAVARAGTTPDGLIMYPQEGVGLVVSAAEHVFVLSKSAESAEALNDIADLLDMPTGHSPRDVVEAVAKHLALTTPKT